MKQQRVTYSIKRVKVLFATVVAFSLLAGVLQLASMALSSGPDADAAGSKQEVLDKGAEADKDERSSGRSSKSTGKNQGSDDANEKSGSTSGKSASVRSGSTKSKTVAGQAGKLSGLVLDGHAISADKASALVAKKRDFTSHVKFIDQYEVMPSGCEIVALSILLRSMGYDVDPQDLADNYVDMSGSFPTGYSGSPYENGCGLPPCIAAAGKAWLGKHAKGYHAHDTTKTPFDALTALVERGYPVLIWTTEGMVAPSDVEEYGGYVWYWPLHCVTVYGTNKNNVLVCDSIYGMVEYDRESLAAIYEACGSMSVAILPV